MEEAERVPLSGKVNCRLEQGQLQTGQGQLQTGVNCRLGQLQTGPTADCTHNMIRYV